MLETGKMGFRKDPYLKWKSGSKGSDGDERLIFDDGTMSLLKFLPDNITEDTPL